MGPGDDEPRAQCRFGGAHRPHRFELDAGERVICQGIQPIWPCGRIKAHPWHAVGTGGRGSFVCPGTAQPPPDEQGPPYAYGTPLRGEGWDD